jgi:hypothetical protein
VFTSVSPDNVPSKYLTYNERLEVIQHPERSHHTFESMSQDPHYFVVDQHLNVNGDYTFVFQHRTTGARWTFANVSAMNVPRNLYVAQTTQGFPVK